MATKWSNLYKQYGAAVASDIREANKPWRKGVNDAHREGLDALKYNSQAHEGYKTEADRLRGQAELDTGVLLNNVAAQGKASEAAVNSNLDYLRNLFGGETGTDAAGQAAVRGAAVEGDRGGTAYNAALFERRGAAQRSFLNQMQAASYARKVGRADDIREETRRRKRDLMDVILANRAKGPRLKRDQYLEDRDFQQKQGYLDLQNRQQDFNENVNIRDFESGSGAYAPSGGTGGGGAGSGSYGSQQELIDGVIGRVGNSVKGLELVRQAGTDKDGNPVMEPVANYQDRVKNYIAKKGAARAFQEMVRGGVARKDLALFFNNLYGGNSWQRLGKYKGRPKKFNWNKGIVQYKNKKGKWVKMPSIGTGGVGIGGNAPSAKQPDKSYGEVGNDLLGR